MGNDRDTSPELDSQGGRTEVVQVKLGPLLALVRRRNVVVPRVDAGAEAFNALMLQRVVNFYCIAGSTGDSRCKRQEGEPGNQLSASPKIRGARSVAWKTSRTATHTTGTALAPTDPDMRLVQNLRNTQISID